MPTPASRHIHYVLLLTVQLLMLCALSRTALAWLRKKEIRTSLIRSPKNDALFDLTERALQWIRLNT